MKITLIAWVSVFLVALALIGALGCTKSTAARPPDALSVEVVQVEQRDVPVYGEWIGTLDGLVNADI